MAELTGISVYGLESRRRRGLGPAFFRATGTGRPVRYRLEDVTAWLDERARAAADEADTADAIAAHAARVAEAIAVGDGAVEALRKELYAT